MKARKYTLIAIALVVLLYIWRFASAVSEHGLPIYPLYYIASVIEIGLGYLTYRFTESHLAKRLPFLVIIIMVLCIGIPAALYSFRIGILWQVGGSPLWYLLSLSGFWGFNYIKKVIKKSRSRTELTKEEEDTEYLARGLILGPVLIALVIAIPLAILFAIIFLLACC